MVRRHAEDAAFYWARRQDAALSAAHDLRSLARFDFLLDANLEGLRVAQIEGQPTGRAGWEPTWQRTQQWQTADESFVAAVLALEASADGGNGEHLAALQELACDQLDDARGSQAPGIASGLTSAAAWLRWPAVESAVQSWASSPEPLLRRCALAACALHRLPAGAALTAWLDDPHAMVRTRALRAAGELGRDDLIAPLRRFLLQPAGAAEPCPAPDRHWAAWALCVLGSADSLGAGPDGLGDAAGSSARGALLSAWAVAAADEQVAAWVDTALRDRARWRDALAVMRDSGLARWLPVLLQVIEHQLEAPALQGFFEEPRSNLARPAADAFAHISGLRIADQHWMPEPEPPSATDDDAGLDPAIPAARKQDVDHGLLWPDLPALKRWWSAHRDAFDQGSARAGRWLEGKPLTPASAATTLTSQTATQCQRHHAALYLRCHGHTATLFDVRAALGVQRSRAGELGLSMP